MTGAELIQQERKRQVEVEGWTPEHDDKHDDQELVLAAIAYASHNLNVDTLLRTRIAGTASWPWDCKWWKPRPDPVRNLVKAGALIAAEIDRLRVKAASDAKERGNGR